MKLSTTFVYAINCVFSASFVPIFVQSRSYAQMTKKDLNVVRFEVKLFMRHDTDRSPAIITRVKRAFTAFQQIL